MSLRLACSRHFRSSFFILLAFAAPLLGVDSVFSATDESHHTARIGVVLERPSADAAIIDALCRIGLYDAAITRCRSSIEGEPAGAMLQARWVGFLIESLAERDAEQAEKIQDALKESKKVHDAYVADPKNQATRVWVAYSYEAVRLKLISRSVASYLAAPTNKARREDALETIRILLDRLVELKEQAHAQLGVALRRNERNSAIQSRDLSSLHNRLSMLEIDCMLMRCDCYPPDSSERIAAGTEAMAAIEKITARIDSDWSGQELMDLARNQSLIALSRYGDAAQSLSKWITTVDDPVLRHRGIALLSKAYQMQGDFGSAVKALLTANGDALQESPEIALATLELQIASWKKRVEQSSSNKPSDKENNEEIDRILKTKEVIAARFGNYWRQRAEALIVASSLGAPASSNSKPHAASLDLLKVNIRQRLTAGDVSAAITLLDEAEAACLVANDLKQALGFAKSAIGVMQQQVAGSEPTNLPNARAIIQRIASTARKYSVDETSPQLHRSAIERQKNLLAVETTSTDTASIAETYQQMLLDHVTTWPDDLSSDEIRSQLQQLYLRMGAVPSLVELWSNELAWLTTSDSKGDSNASTQFDARLATATASYVNAKLLNSLIAETRKEPSVGTHQVLEALSTDSRWMIEALTADYDWWSIDGGIRMLDSKPLTRSLSPNAFEKNASASSMDRILGIAMKPELKDIQADIQRVIEWTQADNHGRMGWLTAFQSSLSNILRVRMLSKGIDRTSKEWLDGLALLQTAMQDGLANAEASLPPEISTKLKEHAVIASARIDALRGNVDAGIAKLEQLRSTDARNPRWTLELARIYEMQDTGIENGLNLYRQLATGSPVGSDYWFESRLSSIRCLRRQEKSVEADKLVSLVQAMVADIPEKWKRRLK